MEQFALMLLEFLRKQAFAVVVLVCCVGGLIWFATFQKADFDRQLAAMDAKFTQCGEAREADGKTIRSLLVDLATVKETVRLMKLTPRRN